MMNDDIGKSVESVYAEINRIIYIFLKVYIYFSSHYWWLDNRRARFNHLHFYSFHCRQRFEFATGIHIPDANDDFLTPRAISAKATIFSCAQIS